MGNCRIDYCKMNLSIKNAKTGKKKDLDKLSERYGNLFFNAYKKELWRTIEHVVSIVKISACGGRFFRAVN